MAEPMPPIDPEDFPDLSLRETRSLENVPPLPEQDPTRCFQHFCSMPPTVKATVDNGSTVYLCASCARAYPHLYPFLNFTMEALS